MARMSMAQLSHIRRSWLDKHQPYNMLHYSLFNYDILDNVFYRQKSGKKNSGTYNDIIIMFDTETSKSAENTTYTQYSKKARCDRIHYNTVNNYVVAWSMCLYAFDRPIVTLWGKRPSELVDCIEMCVKSMKGQQTFIYAHNLQYDYTFCRQFFMRGWDRPAKQLNTKSHNPILIEYRKDDYIITFKDSLILSQRSLEKWATDLNVSHQKAVGKWDYNKIRNQSDPDYEGDELDYIECDVLAGCECIDALMKQLNKHIYSMPYTATGIPREEVKKLANANGFRDRFLSMVLSFEQYRHMEKVYHGGYTHANRHYVNLEACKLFGANVVCFDFASSYPYVMLAEKYPMEKFVSMPDMSVDDIIEDSENTAYTFDLILVKPRLIDDFTPMPTLQKSKCIKDVDAVVDNGRILCAGYVKIALNEQDIQVINEQYTWDYAICTNVECARKDYLPRWFTDYVYALFKAKTKLKTSEDVVAYALAKAKLNSLYGMLVQKSIRDNIIEDYDTGEYKIQNEINIKTGQPYTDEELYEKYVNKYTSVLPFQWGAWVTSSAFKNLHALGACVDYEHGGQWLYSDTDSCYAVNWDIEKVEAYNQKCIEKMRANGYDGVEHEGKIYYLGVAEFDGEYEEFITTGAKRYACRYAECEGNKEKNWHKLKITVAGVPKKNGAKCLNNDISNFRKGFIFDGLITGKLAHTYVYTDSIKVDENGNEYADCIDLTPCDYLLDDIEVPDWEDIYYDEIEVQTYED